MVNDLRRSACAQTRGHDFVFAPVRGRNRAKTSEFVGNHASCISIRMQPSEPIHLLLTETTLSGWLGQAAAGDILEYHRGFLIRDISPLANRLPDGERAALLQVARRALWAAEHDLVHLVQRRLGPEEFAYLAIARPRKATPSLSHRLFAEAA